MPDLWLPGATRVPGNNGLLQGAGGGKGKRFHTWHTFEGIPADYSYSPDCVQAAQYLNSKGSTSHFVLNIKTGAIAQLLPADQAARTLRVSDPATGEFADVNRHGDIHMQTEVLANARRPFNLDLTPDGLRGLQTLVNFLRAWGTPDQWAWADQAPPVYPGGSVRRRWPDQSGHAYHAGWPVNNHGDPGAIDPPWVVAGLPPTLGSGDGPELGNPEDVKALQAALNNWGHHLDVDGSYGPLTQTAAKSTADDTDYTGDVTDVAALTAHLEETAMSLLTDLPRAILDAPFPLSALSKKAGITAGTVGDVLDLTMRRALGAWTYAHEARAAARATADRLAGLEVAVQSLASHTPGVDADEVARQIAERVGQYELTLRRAETPDEAA